ncbi:MAG: sigma-70 domain-containing protein [Lachnospiraceae bacterium]
MYLEEIEKIPACTPQEEAELLLRIRSGDETAKQRLTEGSLKALAVMAKEYENQGLSEGDLIQEANVAFLMLVNRYEEHMGTFRDCLDTCVRQALQDAVAFQKNEANVEEELAARVNVLKKVSQIMADELGREATVEELAQKMKMTVEEIKDIMKLTLDAMSVSP